MQNFETYFSEDAIIAYLCKQRVTIAKQRNKKHLIHLLTNSEKFNYHRNDTNKHFEGDDKFLNEFLKFEKDFLSDLDRLLPKRKQWVTIGRTSRTNKKFNLPKSSYDKNFESLIKTIKKFRKKSPNESWLQELDKFILDVQMSVMSGTYKVATPLIYPKLKNKIKVQKKNECRPISLFPLKDKVILSLTNKFLTKLLDRYFESCSYAFRIKKNEENSEILTHHDCIKNLLNYRATYQDKPLWVVECDMEKFYDSVNHNIIKNIYNSLIENAKIDFPKIDLKKPTHIFHEYLSCYAFNKNVPLSSDLDYWHKYNIPNGEFEWVNKSFEELGYYDNLNNERIGVPQGGALSGLIANIVLDIADKEVVKSKVYYIRFCDDMLIIHHEEDECIKAKEVYLQVLRQLKLVPHQFTNILMTESINKKHKKILQTTLPFWNQKSKGPYKWASIKDGGFPWIGFVGYEIHHSGSIRVRKKSLLKELAKQKKIVNEIRDAIKQNRRKSLGTVSESVIHRLVGMSVGRVSIRNFDFIDNDFCWKNGFRELSFNEYSVQQIKQLDRNRNKHYYDFVKELDSIEEIETHNEPSSRRQIIHFNKPFSYYYQILERAKKNKKD